MALQATHSFGGRSGISTGHADASVLAGLNLYWSEHHKSPLLQWEKRLELFTVAKMAKQSISLSELTRTEGGQRVASLMGGLSEETASKIVISILFVSVGQAARKTLLDKFPTTQITTITLPALLHQCEQTFVVKRNRTLGRYRFFSRKQENRESLQHFWNALNGLAAKRQFEEQTNSLVCKTFILSMHYKAVDRTQR